MGESNLSAEKKLDLLYDHYKDSFANTKEYLKSRDRMFFYVLLTLTAMFIAVVAPGNSSKVASQFLMDEFRVALHTNFLVSVFWFILMCLVLRYFQTTVTVEKQYEYIHTVEEQICTVAGSDIVTREGRAYLTNYPVFKQWAHIVYTMIFPAFLLGITVVKLYKEFLSSVPLFNFRDRCVLMWIYVGFNNIVFMVVSP